MKYIGNIKTIVIYKELKILKTINIKLKEAI